jgi:hypothetical protein
MKYYDHTKTLCYVANKTIDVECFGNLEVQYKLRFNIEFTYVTYNNLESIGDSEYGVWCNS